jgi:hypothetical protein
MGDIYSVGINGFLDYFRRPVFYKIENTTFRKLDLFPSSGEGEDTYPVRLLRKSYSQSVDNSCQICSYLIT